LESHPGAAGSFKARIPTGNSRVIDEVPSFQAEQDLLLDSLSYLRAGRWQGFQQLATAIRKDEGFFAYRAAEVLVTLGHIELERDRNMRPARWCISPPVIVAPSGDEPPFLAGFRSHELVTAVRNAAEEAGGCLQFETPVESPSIIRLLSVGHEQLGGIASLISDRLGIRVPVNDRVSSDIAGMAASLPEILSALPALDQPSADQLEAYYPDRRRWRPIKSGLIGRGAYRLKRYPRIYGVVTAADEASQTMRAADPVLAKLIGHVLAGHKLIRWDREDGELRSVQGLPLPSLHERALALCAGRPPTVEGQQRIFRGIPQEIGDAVFRLVQDGSEWS
jgi:hypothetical protein